LSFFDFSSDVDVQNDVATGGNARLVPEQSWEAKVEATRSLGAAGSITVGGFADWISDLVDQVPLSATEEGIGNIDRARRWGVTGRGTLLLDPVGLRGVRISANGTFADSSVRDPLTGERRRISLDDIRDWSVEFRHDIPGTAIAYGGFIGEDVNGTVFRLDQLSRSILTRPLSSVYIEHKNVFGLTVRAGLRNVTGASDGITRTVYVDRRDGPVAFEESQRRKIHLIGTLSINGSF
jgi:outer membrane receptor for ferrienterochelin and colicins